MDNDPTWRKKPRPIGRYVSTSWIPGNLLSEGMYFIGPVIRTSNPNVRRLGVYDAVGMHVIDSMEGNGARVDSLGHLPGVVRPLLKWRRNSVQMRTQLLRRQTLLREIRKPNSIKLFCYR